ncbi:hypothetical protein ACFWJT_16030 [Streptomyces sp. NPDC127069]|uniref:hypothetical protein n=1 Tax=Streptomyces sp. NPDC127069 TaxID=3347128 RepID=UPI0036483FCB
MAIELPDELIKLEEEAWTEIQAGRLTVETANKVQDAIIKYASTHNVSRLKVEHELKKLVRHPKPPTEA